MLLSALLVLLAFYADSFATAKDDDPIVPAVRVVRLQVDYPEAKVQDVQRIHKWNSLMRNSVIASLRFINKHWTICGSGPNGERPANDCGKAQITGEIVSDNHYRINVTFISERDPIKNVKVDSTSTVYAVSQIGLKGGIFQYTNALKALGKPSPKLEFDEAYFCYKGAVLVDGDKCRKEFRRLRDEPIVEREPIKIDRLIAL
ncbi:hypothetical protein Q1695_001858 [Nippostrongylus brasiliensis]|nr:hypothetical protein Q1695_001858 [Nippostrongylus brasiliensis]